MHPVALSYEGSGYTAAYHAHTEMMNDASGASLHSGAVTRERKNFTGSPTKRLPEL